MTKLLIAASLIGMLSMAAAARADTSAADFVKKASIANEFEIESSKLALEKSQDKNVKSFAQRMVDDHTKTGEKLQSVLKTSRSGAMPADKLDSKHQSVLDKLTAASGDDFNKQYVSAQVDAHKEAVSLFSDYASNGDDAPLKQFASDTLPTLKDHLTHVQELKDKE